ncbi:unnamed protein product [Wickerhamomyces anomalus]
MIVQAKEDYYTALEIEIKVKELVDPKAGDVIFKNLNRAYEVLLDPTKKSEYDKWYKKFYKRTHVTQNHIAKERTKKQKMEQAELRRMKEESGKKNQAEKDAKVQEAERERKAREKQKREEEVLKKRREEEKRKIEEKLRKEKMEQKKKEQERANEEKEQKLRAEQALRDEKARKLREEVLKKQSAERARKEKLKQRSEELKNLFPSNEGKKAKRPASQSAYPNSGWSNPQYYASSGSQQNGRREFARPRKSRFKEQHMSKADFHKKIRELQQEAEKCHEDREKFTNECEDFDKIAERIELSAEDALEKAERKYRESIAIAEAMFNKAKLAQESANMAHFNMELYLKEYEELFNKYGNIYGEPNSEGEEEVSEGSEEEGLEPETPKPFKFDFNPPKTDHFQLKSNPWKTYIDTCKGENKVLCGSVLEKQAQIFIFFQFTSNYPVPSMLLLYCKSKMKLNSTPATHRNTRNKLALETRDLWNKAVQEALKAQSS